MCMHVYVHPNSNPIPITAFYPHLLLGDTEASFEAQYRIACFEISADDLCLLLYTLHRCDIGRGGFQKCCRATSGDLSVDRMTYNPNRRAPRENRKRRYMYFHTSGALNQVCLEKDLHFDVN